MRKLLLLLPLLMLISCDIAAKNAPQRFHLQGIKSERLGDDQTDIYLLDMEKGRVWRLTKNGSGFLPLKFRTNEISDRFSFEAANPPDEVVIE